MNKIESALLSVSDKTGLPEFARRLRELGVSILSTGGTAKLLRENDIAVREVSDYTGFPEILDGRIKTLHPRIHGGVMARREKEEHRRQLDELDIDTIDMVVVNLYPFEETIAEPGAELTQAVENIDVGGATLIRAAAKNYTHVAVVTSPERYDRIATELEEGAGCLHERTHHRLALEAFRHTARYDAAIARHMGEIWQEPGHHADTMMMELDKRQELRYGENPHQTAAYYVERRPGEPSVSTSNQVAGPELSFNNILDLDVGLELVKEFDLPTAACIKHANPVGVATAESIHEAYREAYRGNPRSAPGAVVTLNRPFDRAAAEMVGDFGRQSDGEKLPNFVEVLAAPSVQREAIKYLYTEVERGNKIRLLETGQLSAMSLDETQKDMRRVVGGMLVQDRNLLGFDRSAVDFATDDRPDEPQMRDLAFAWICCKHTRSNAICLAHNRTLVGVGAAHMNRMEAVNAAIKDADERARDSVLASDGTLLSPETVDRAADAGIAAIIHPGGGPAQQEVVDRATERHLPMVLSGVRHFKH